MIDLIHLSQGVVERGLLFGIVVLSVYISSRLIHFDNLSVEGAFGLGGALSALLLKYGINPWLTLLASILVGACTGIATGLLSTKLRLNNLISGIVVTTGLFSITLKVGGSNMVINKAHTVFKSFGVLPTSFQTILVLAFITLSLFFALGWFLTTEVGFLLRSAGDAPQMLTNLGKSVHGYTTFGLVLSNALAALSGALFVHYAGYFSIWANIGILITGLAGMILAETINKSFGISLLVGSIIYQALIALTFECQLNQDWNKLVTATLIVVLIVIKDYTKRSS
jgi:putative ABC transport system permease protein